MAALLQITSGRGPVECCRLVALLAESLCADARSRGIAAEIIEQEAGPHKETLFSALIHLEGAGLQEFCSSYLGTVQWINPSSYRPGHRRKNWFAGVHPVELPRPVTPADRDIRLETMKGSGPGGQHVNTTESAVRATHIPTGLTAIARDERSQAANRKRALARLSILLARQARREQAQTQKERWDAHNELERGNPVRVYRGSGFEQMPADKGCRG